ncbi:DUF5067 domain-containing protein [Lactococcus termiticola]|uniref:DUF5067 domain-containing protein n=1 Tax=Lactococcus termiticola TaxID=2169526 RepID=A0A2R5HDG5_9LACT|nr:DUF5067 domain-containing protein [Lactococcus termiticola]GBG96062.1 hypothetical protein NtB2_00165 [Lactococcus termiticola]
MKKKISLYLIIMLIAMLLVVVGTMTFLHFQNQPQNTVNLKVLDSRAFQNDRIRYDQAKQTATTEHETIKLTSEEILTASNGEQSLVLYFDFTNKSKEKIDLEGFADSYLLVSQPGKAYDRSLSIDTTKLKDVSVNPGKTYPAQITASGLLGQAKGNFRFSIFSQKWESDDAGLTIKIPH